MIFFLITVILGTTLISQGQRRIPVQYARRTVGTQTYGNQVGGGYFFVVKGTNQSDAGVFSVSLFTDSLQIFQGNKLTLRSRINGNASASYFKSPTNPYYEIYKTDSTNFLGEIWVKKLDSINQIVSGTFWFDAVDSNGIIVQVREGRFDMNYYD